MRILALAVLLALVLPKPLAFASPPDPTWIGGIYDGADGDDVVVRTMTRAGSIGVAVVAPRPVLRLEPLVAPGLPGYEYRPPVPGARGPPGGARLVGALPCAVPTPVESACRSLAVSDPRPWSARGARPVCPRRGLVWLRGPPGQLPGRSWRSLERSSPIPRRDP